MKDTFGVFYEFQAVLLAVGILYLTWKKPRGWILLIGWLIISPIPASLVSHIGWGDHNWIRGVMRCLIPLPSILSAIGLVFLMDSIRKIIRTRKIVPYLRIVAVASLILFVLLSGWEVKRFIRHVLFDETFLVHNQCRMDSAMKRLIQYTESVKNDYDKICFSPKLVDIRTGPLHHLLFYTKMSPREYQEFGLKNTKYRITSLEDCLNESGKILYVLREDEREYVNYTKKFFCGENKTVYVALTEKDIVSK